MKLPTLILFLLLSVAAPAQVVTDPGVTAGISAQLAQGSTQIASLSQLVTAAKTQLDTLSKVSEGIRNLENVVKGGVQGLLGDAADKLGLKDVFTIGKQLQSTFTDGMQLYKDVKSLPEDAKQQLKGIGLAVEDLEQYLSTGLVYDAFQGMDIADWQKVFKNPMDALAQGALGRACNATEAYTDTETMRRQYADRLAAMTPEERASMSGSVGFDMAFLNATAWAKKMDERVTKSLNFSILADKVGDAVGGKGKSLTVTEQAKASGAVGIAVAKVEIENGKQRNEANDQTVGLLRVQTQLDRNEASRAQKEDDTAAMTADR